MNDVPLGSQKYAKKCSYILQDDNLYPSFTVHETMLLAANLKIADMTTDEKNLIVSSSINNTSVSFGSIKSILLHFNTLVSNHKSNNNHFR